MKKLVIALVMLTTLPQLFTACRKGEEDPLISLRSRKARITGKWTLKEGMEKKSEPGTTIQTRYDGTKAHWTYNALLTGGVGSYEHTEHWEFKKDGTFLASIVSDKKTSSLKGNWNFTSGIGKETKNKEQLILNVSFHQTDSATTTSSGSKVDYIFDIDRLKNKMITLKRINKITENGMVWEHVLEKTYVQ